MQNKEKERRVEREYFSLAKVDIKKINDITPMQRIATEEMSFDDAVKRYEFSYEPDKVFINPATSHYILPTAHKYNEKSKTVFNDNSVINRDGKHLIVIMNTTDAGCFRIVVR